jgi:rhodanese-related sulfurtransferase
MKNINPRDFLELQEVQKITIVDIREFKEVHQLPFESTVNIPLNTILTKYNDLLNKTETYYIICHHGQRSSFVTNLLTEYGYDVINVVGGVDLVNRYR